MPLGLLEAGAAADSFVSGVADVVSVFSNNVVPLLKTSPMNYFIGVAIFSAGCAVFACARRTAH